MAMRLLLAAAFGWAGMISLACGQNPTSPPSAAASERVVLRGAGATFPAPLYRKWIDVYTRANPNVAIEYQDVGSGEGTQLFLQNAVEFGASDSALNDEQIQQAKAGATLVPATAGVIVLAYHLPDVTGTLKLSRDVYADIFLGKIREWNGEFESINQRLSAQRDPMSDEVIANLLAGYTFVDILLDWGIDVFTMGKHKYLLELNNIVLCGPDQTLRAEFAQHLQATATRFYEEPEGGIEDVVEWRARHLDQSVWQLAAGLYVRALSKPQLFIEGNHRTSALLASYVLLRDGKPPFVLTVENAVAYFEPSTVLRNISKLGPMALFRLPGINKRFARFLEAQADPRYLLAADAQTVSEPSHRQIPQSSQNFQPNRVHDNMALLGTPPFEENPHVRQDP